MAFEHKVILWCVSLLLVIAAAIGTFVYDQKVGFGGLEDVTGTVTAVNVNTNVGYTNYAFSDGRVLTVPGIYIGVTWMQKINTIVYNKRGIWKIVPKGDI